MRKSTHLAMGVAAAAPLAVFMPPVGAAGCLWFGLIGGAFPDYADLRSGMKRYLKHRGFSHSLAMLAIAGAFVYVLLNALHNEWTGLLHVPRTDVVAWTAAFCLGFASHMLGDACTRGGIRPFLPFWQKKMWIVPRLFRGKSVGWQNHFATAAAVIVIGVCLGGWVALQAGLVTLS